jgi:hypothetical protein
MHSRAEPGYGRILARRSPCSRRSCLPLGCTASRRARPGPAGPTTGRRHPSRFGRCRLVGPSLVLETDADRSLGAGMRQEGSAPCRARFARSAAALSAYRAASGCLAPLIWPRPDSCVVITAADLDCSSRWMAASSAAGSAQVATVSVGPASVGRRGGVQPATPVTWTAAPRRTLSSGDFGSSVERTAKLHPLWQPQCGWVLGAPSNGRAHQSGWDGLA